MRLGIGIDTGGTYTDAVIYDFESSTVICTSKALTTRDNLETGIEEALDALDASLFPEVEIVALSTTLATNACVENKGGRAKLLFFGVDEKVFDMVGKNYGLSDKADVFFCDRSTDSNGTKAAEPEWEKLFASMNDWISDAESIGIVEVFAMNDGAELEKKAKQKLVEKCDIPVICGHELFYELNSIQRGASTLLNAKLVPIIQDFIASIKRSLASRDIKAPIAVVRSDSTLMSEDYSKQRPVETILSGPAASVIGGMSITCEADSIIVDMGGTTTDISIVRKGVPKVASNGVNIGKWRTFVHGVYIDTFGLGGDSTIRLINGKVTQEPRRMMPLSIAAHKWPEIICELRELVSSENLKHYPVYEFLSLVKDIKDDEVYTKEEKKLCTALHDGPLMIEKAALAVKRDIYTLNTKRLESEGIIMRIGLTPTDIMHIKGDFNAFNKEAPKLAVQYILRCLADETGKVVDESGFCDMVYDLIKLKLYTNIVRITLEDKYPDMMKNGLSPQLEWFITKSFEERNNEQRDFAFTLQSSLVGIGAPIHIFLPDVAKALGTKCVIPKHAGVANAIGAVVSNISASSCVEIRPSRDGSGYMVFGKERKYDVKSMEEAVEIAKAEVVNDAVKEARRRGITEDPEVSTDIKTNIVKTRRNDSVDLGTKVTATATGKITV